MMDHVALGIKIEGSEEWVKFIATEEEYDSDVEGLAKSEYHDVFLVSMKGVVAKKRLVPGSLVPRSSTCGRSCNKVRHMGGQCHHHKSLDIKL